MNVQTDDVSACMYVCMHVCISFSREFVVCHGLGWIFCPDSGCGEGPP